MYTSSPRSTMLSKAHHAVSFSSCAVQTEMYTSQLYSWEMRGFPAHSKPKLTASVCVYVCLLADLCAAVSLCDPMDCSPPGSSVRWILQARILEWVAISSSTGSSRPRDRIRSLALQAHALPTEPPGKLLTPLIVPKCTFYKLLLQLWFTVIWRNKYSKKNKNKNLHWKQQLREIGRGRRERERERGKSTQMVWVWIKVLFCFWLFYQ